MRAGAPKTHAMDAHYNNGHDLMILLLIWQLFLRNETRLYQKGRFKRSYENYIRPLRYSVILPNLRPPIFYGGS